MKQYFISHVNVFRDTLEHIKSTILGLDSIALAELLAKQARHAFIYDGHSPM